MSPDVNPDPEVAGEIPGRVPILTYHSLDRSGSVISMPPVTFAEQMRTLAERGFTGITVDALLRAWKDEEALPERPVVLTFDDGFANFVESGFPVLEELGFRATIYAIPGLVGRTNDWPGQAGGIPELPLLSWSSLEGLVEAGFEVGAHTVTHRRLPSLPPDEAALEVRRSGQMIEDRLGKRVRTFAYPFGSVGSTLEVVRQRYDGACGTRLATARPKDDRCNLPRIDMYYLRHPATFRLFGSSAGDAYIGLRRTGNLARRLLERAGVLTLA